MDQDLTDGEVFDWFAYLGKHPNGNMIFNGARIVAFTIAKLASMDSNTNQHRYDFCIFRDGGRMVRLHPSSSKKALPVECDMIRQRSFWQAIAPGRSGSIEGPTMAAREG